MTARTAPEELVLECRKYYRELPNFLEWETPFQLLICVILSAQTTDAQVNRVRGTLFANYPTAEALARARQEHVEQLIKSTGYYRNKAKNVIAAAKHLVQNHNGEVPSEMDDLVEIPGVGRKSAGVVLHHVYDKPAIIVDTHFGRVCRRLGLSQNSDPVKLERDIAHVLDERLWSECSMFFNLHGRRFCHARSPLCADCFLAAKCPSAIAVPK